MDSNDISLSPHNGARRMFATLAVTVLLPFGAVALLTLLDRRA